MFAAHREAKAKRASQAEVKQDEVATFLDSIVKDAFAELQDALQAVGRTVTVSIDRNAAIFSATFNGRDEYRMEIKRDRSPLGVEVKTHTIVTDSKTLCGAYSSLRSGHQPNELGEITSKDIAERMVEDYKHVVHVLDKLDG